MKPTSAGNAKRKVLEVIKKLPAEATVKVSDTDWPTLRLSNALFAA